MLQPRIISVKPISNYRLELQYETGENKILDVKPYIIGDWFGKLSDQSYFKAVKIIRNGKGIEWPDGQDVAPHELYNNSASVL